jgi:hypothetical protein
MSSNYPPGVSGFEPQIAGGDETEGEQDLECGNEECLYEQCVGTFEDYGHGEVTWTAEWICDKCGEKNSREGWYDPNDNS